MLSVPHKRGTLEEMRRHLHFQGTSGDTRCPLKKGDTQYFTGDTGGHSKIFGDIQGHFESFNSGGQMCKGRHKEPPRPRHVKSFRGHLGTVRPFGTLRNTKCRT